jgi:hypothetical protein
MYRLLIASAAFAASAAIVFAQEPPIRSTRSASRAIMLPIAVAPEMSCKVISDTEVEVQFRDQSTRRVAIPAAMTTIAVTESPAKVSFVGGRRASAELVATTAGVGVTTQVTRGFDEDGQPYVDERQPDGTIRRTQQYRIIEIKPDGSRRVIPLGSIRSNAQPPTPPQLPADPVLGRRWVELHNEAILGVIRALVNDSAAEMAKFSNAEQAATGSDLFAQTAYRTKVASFLAGQR